jgi:SAM-dependent methyltransferase
VLNDRGLGSTLVDRRAHADSYADAPTVTDVVASLVTQLELVPVLDIGCGRGALLVQLARRDHGCVGWGVDANPEMCAAARSLVAAKSLDDIVTIIEADALFPEQLRAAVDPRIRCVVATSVLNGLWSGDPARPNVSEWLSGVAEILPGRAVIIADYFGRLGQVPPPWPLRTALHDLVQGLSGQGVPPPDHDGWRDQYRRAGAQLLHMIEDEKRTFFVHLLRLASGAMRHNAAASPDPDAESRRWR